MRTFYGSSGNFGVTGNLTDMAIPAAHRRIAIAKSVVQMNDDPAVTLILFILKRAAMGKYNKRFIHFGAGRKFNKPKFISLFYLDRKIRNT